MRQKPKKITFVSSLGYPPERVGGAQISTMTLATRLQARGHRVEICFPQEFETAKWQKWRRRLTGRDGLERRHKGIRQVVFSRLDRTGFDAYMAALRQHLHRQRPDLLVVGEGRTLDMAHALKGTVAHCVIQFRDAEHALQAQSDDAQHQPFPAGDFIANSAFIADHFAPLIGHKIPHFPPTIDLAAYRAPADHDFEAGKAVLFVNPIPWKGLDMALQLADLLPNVPFHFLESWPLTKEAFAALAAEADCRPNLHLLPALPDIRQAFADARCVIVPSEWDEAWCRVITEAQTWGLPVIARDVGGISEALGGAGILMPRSADAPTWARALQSVLDSPAVRTDLRHRGQQRVLELDARTAAHIKHLESIIA